MIVKFFEYRISNVLPNWPISNKIIINTINPHSFCVAVKEKRFKEALIKSDILIPDGIGIVWALKVLNKIKISRITGADMHNHLLNLAEINTLKVFYLGASESTLLMIQEKLKIEHPSVKVGYFSPKFKNEFSVEESLEMIKNVNKYSPDILFVGMTAPKQEKWCYKFKNELNANIIVSIGAVFDFYAGTVNRAPKIMIKLNLEWFYRLYKEPKRMWRRYLINNFKFVFYILKEKYIKKNAFK